MRLTTFILSLFAATTGAALAPPGGVPHQATDNYGVDKSGETAKNCGCQTCHRTVCDANGKNCHDETYACNCGCH
jgi:hypothetical protein